MFLFRATQPVDIDWLFGCDVIGLLQSNLWPGAVILIIYDRIVVK